MKNKKVIISIILIILCIIIACFVRTIVQYNNKYKISDDKILKYLNSKYDGDFKDVKLIDTKQTKTIREGGSIDGSQFNTLYYNDFAYYYSVYSSKYDTNFIVVYEKQLPVISILGSTLRFPNKKITDNLEQTNKSKELAKEVSNSLNTSNMKVESEIYEANFNVGTKYIITVDHNLSMSDYDGLMEFQKKLEDEPNLKNQSKNKKGEIEFSYQYIIQFNNITLKSSTYNNKLITEGGTLVDINNANFYRYIN